MSEEENPDWTEVNEGALALYKADHPEYTLDTFESVPLLRTVTDYRYRAWRVIQAAHRFRTSP
jgi:hypothetical protein